MLSSTDRGVQSQVDGKKLTRCAVPRDERFRGLGMALAVAEVAGASYHDIRFLIKGHVGVTGTTHPVPADVVRKVLLNHR